MLAIILLSIIQGISEFLPISSSAHLIIFRDIFLLGKDVISENMELTFDIALHFGTVLAIIVFFYKDLWKIISKGLTKGVNDKDGRILFYIIAATIPAAIVGLLFESTIEKVIRSEYLIIALSMMLMGVIIYLVDKKMKRTKKIKDMSIIDAFFIGCMQIFALIPGFSRSGTTIAAARGLKYDREDAAKFSFYLSAPIVTGALILRLLKTDLAIIGANIWIFLVGILMSFLSGFICINFLLKYLKKNDFKIFMWYRLALGLLVILYLIIRP